MGPPERPLADDLGIDDVLEATTGTPHAMASNEVARRALIMARIGPRHVGGKLYQSTLILRA